MVLGMVGVALGVAVGLLEGIESLRGDLAWVTLAFGLITVITMTGVVVLISKGLLHLKLGWRERCAHALAGVIIALSGLSVKLLVL